MPPRLYAALLELVAALRDDRVEVLEPERIVDRLISLIAASRDQRSLHPGSAALTPEQADSAIAAVERAMAARATVLDVYAEPLWSLHPSLQRVLRTEAVLGVRHRRSPVPARLSVFDQRVVVLDPRPDDDPSTALVVTHPAAASLALQIHARAWRGGQDLVTAGARQARQRAVLEALAAGWTDARTARELGISPRTLARVIADLQQELGAVTRFQLAVKAAEAGLLDPEEPL